MARSLPGKSDSSCVFKELYILLWIYVLNVVLSEIVLVVLCDLSKGFDLVDHDLLLSKLRQHNVDTAWCESYLSGHVTQQVQYRAGADGRFQALVEAVAAPRGWVNRHVSPCIITCVISPRCRCFTCTCDSGAG